MEQKKKEEQEKENSRILTEKLEAAGKSIKNLKLKGKDGSKGDDNKVENKNNHLETMVNTNF